MKSGDVSNDQLIFVNTTMVSAVIITHNRKELLARAIDSVLAQNDPNIECIVVSDNSTDGTNEYCRSLEGIIFIEICAEESHGGNHARNVGILAAKGEYIALLDDDDYWLPGKIEKQMTAARQTNCGLIFCDRIFERVGRDGTITLNEENKTYSHSENYQKDVLLTCCISTSSTMMIRKDLLLEVGLFDENLGFWQDYELTIRLAQVTGFLRIPEPLAVYRIDQSDKSRLTNRYYEWWDAVKYIHSKHSMLYSRLSHKEKKKVKVLTFRDALSRAKTCGLKREKIKLKWKIVFYGFGDIISDKLNAIFR